MIMMIYNENGNNGNEAVNSDGHNAQRHPILTLASIGDSLILATVDILSLATAFSQFVDNLEILGHSLDFGWLYFVVVHFFWQKLRTRFLIIGDNQSLSIDLSIHVNLFFISEKSAGLMPS